MVEWGDDRRYFAEARDLVGDWHYRQHLESFSGSPDYGRAIRIGKHLASEVFDGYHLQGIAEELAEQLVNRRAEDIETLRPPSTQEWAEIQEERLFERRNQTPNYKPIRRL